MNARKRGGLQSTAAFDNLLCRPLGGRMRRHLHVENLPAGVMDHEEHVQRSKRDGLETEENARPDGRRVLPQEPGRRASRHSWGTTETAINSRQRWQARRLLAPKEKSR
jgi:hypothetical protein